MYGIGDIQGNLPHVFELARTSPTDRWLVRKVDHSFPYNSDISNRWSYSASHLARVNEMLRNHRDRFISKTSGSIIEIFRLFH